MKHLAIKVTNKYESEAVQKALFDMGFRIGSVEFDNNEPEKINVFEPFLPNINETQPDRIVTAIDTKANTIFYLYKSMRSWQDLIVVSSSDFFSTYAGHIERFPDYVSEGPAPKFKIGDKLFFVTKSKIIIVEITEIESSRMAAQTNKDEQAIRYTFYHKHIDSYNGMFFSIIELAVKRFLELNK